MKMSFPTKARAPRALLAVLFSFLISACGAIYKPSPFWGASGYSSTDIDATTVKVSYLTGATSSANVARDYALYRCAELTVERGYDRFVVLDGNASSIGGPYGYTTGATFVIRMFKGEPDLEKIPVKNVTVYRADVVIGRLERRIKR